MKVITAVHGYNMDVITFEERQKKMPCYAFSIPPL